MRGSGYLSSAGRRALARGDIPAAAGLLQRASTLLPPGHAERPRLRLDAAEALTEQGLFDEAGAMLHAAIDEAHELSDRVLEATAQIQELELLYTVDPEAVEPTIVAGVESHLPELESLEAHDGLARAWRLIMFVREMGLQWGESEAAAQLTLDHARLAGNRLMVARAIPSLGYCALSGPTPVPEAIERCRALLEEVSGDRKPEALLEAALSHLEAMRGNVEESRALYRASRAKLEELGWTFLAAQTSFDSGPVEMLAGDLGGRRGRAPARLRRAGPDGRDELHLDDGRVPRGGALPAGRSRGSRGAHQDQRGAGRARRRLVAVPLAERSRQDPRVPR